MILFSRLVMLIIVIVLLVFCMSNLDSVTVKMIGWESPQMPLFLILMFVFFFGFFLALFWQALRSVTMKKEFKPAPVITSEQESKPEKKERKWGLKKKIGKEAEAETDTGSDSAEKVKDGTSDEGEGIQPDLDEPTDVPAIEDKK